MESTDTVEPTSTSSPSNQDIRTSLPYLVCMWSTYIAIPICALGYVSEWTFDAVFITWFEWFFVGATIAVPVIKTLYQFLEITGREYKVKLPVGLIAGLIYVGVITPCGLILGHHYVFATAERIISIAELTMDLPRDNPISVAVRGAGHQGMFLSIENEEVFVESGSNTYSLDDLAESHTKAVAIKTSLISWLDKADARLRAEGAKSKEERKDIATKTAVNDSKSALDLIANCATSVECRSESQ